MLKRSGACVLCACLLGACGACGGRSTAQSDAQTTAAALKGNTVGAAENNPQCKLFTRAEAAVYIGETVAAGDNAAVTTGCQWAASDGSGHVLVQVVPARYHEPPSHAEGFKKIAGVGREAFVVPQMGGWNAGAIDGDVAVAVSVEGPAASADSAIALLKESMRRRTSK